MLTDEFALTGMYLGPAAIAAKRIAASAKKPAAIKNPVRPRSLPIETLIHTNRYTGAKSKSITTNASVVSHKYLYRSTLSFFARLAENPDEIASKTGTVTMICRAQ